MTKKHTSSEEFVREFSTFSRILARADIKVGGQRNWDIQVVDAPKVVERVLSRGLLGLGEAFVAGHWDAIKVDYFVERLLRSRTDREIHSALQEFHFLRARFANNVSMKKPWKLKSLFPKMDNDFYHAILGDHLIYSSAYWNTGAKNLMEAQAANLEYICAKLDLFDGMKILNLDGGWGGLAAYITSKYDIKCTIVCSFPQQLKWIKKNYVQHNIRLFNASDTEFLKEKYDRVISIGFLEHLPKRNSRKYIKKLYECLDNNGRLLLRVIGQNKLRIQADRWLERYIFNSEGFSYLKEITDIIDEFFIIEDLHNLGQDYDQTLVAWYNRFEDVWPKYKGKLDTEKSDRFYRIWKYYLLSCAGAFRAREMHLWQFLLSKK